MFSPFQIFSLTCSRLSARLLMRHLLPCAASVSGYFRSPFYNVGARILFPNESFVNILCRILSLFTYFLSCFVHFRESSCGYTILHTKRHHCSRPFVFLVLLYRMRNASYTKHHTPNSAFRTLCFPPTGPPFSHCPKKNTRLSFTLHRISSLLEPLAALSSTPLSPTSHCSVLRFVRRCRLRLESISLSGAKIMQGTKIRRKRFPLAPYFILFHPWLHRWCAVGVTVLRSISPG